MIDITKIKEKILKEAEEEKRKILLETEKKIKEIEEITVKEIKRLEKEMVQFLEKSMEELQKREFSKFKKEENLKLLIAKWRMIDNLFNSLISEIKKDARYLNLLKEKIQNENAQEIVVSSEDFTLLTHLNSFNKIIKDDKIKGGIIIKREKEEIDLTLENLLNEIKKRYLKEIDQLLFD